MTFQTTVSLVQGFGVPGDIYTDGPHRAESFILNSVDATYNIIGQTCCTVTSNAGEAKAGGTGIFAGFLINPKVQALQGTATDGSLAPTMVLPNYTQVECLTEGSIVVNLPAAATVGDLVVFDNTTGAISTISPSAALPVGTTFAQAKVDYFSRANAGLAVVTVSPTWKIPVLA